MKYDVSLRPVHYASVSGGKDSYEYTRQYREFVKMMKAKEKV